MIPNTAPTEALPPEFVEKMRQLHNSMFPAAFEFDTGIYDNVAKFAHAVIQQDRAIRAGDAPRDVFAELRALTEALLTRADADYLGRQIDAAVKAMAERRCLPPVPWPDEDFGIAVWGRTGDAAADGWLEIWCAPKDGTPILGWCVHSADSYYVENVGCLTDYRARVEGLSHVEDGPHVLVWGEAYEVSDGWENPSCTIPAGWELSHDCEVMANPTHWMPLPQAPGVAPQPTRVDKGEKS